jgi:hypothetical protein
LKDCFKGILTATGKTSSKRNREFRAVIGSKERGELATGGISGFAVKNLRCTGVPAGDLAAGIDQQTCVRVCLKDGDLRREPDVLLSPSAPARLPFSGL